MLFFRNVDPKKSMSEVKKQEPRHIITHQLLQLGEQAFVDILATSSS